MPSLSSADFDALASRHGALLHRSRWQTWRVPVIALTILAYLLFSWWFFGIGKILATANWGIAGNYLADWVSYQIRPELRIDRDGAITISYSRFDPAGPNPTPDWLVTEKAVITRQPEKAAIPAQPAAPAASSAFNFMGAAPQQQAVQAEAPSAPKQEEAVVRAEVSLGSHAHMTVKPGKVIVTQGTESATLTLDQAKERVDAEGPLPEWLEQRQPGGRVLAYFGFNGWAEIGPERVRVNNRFLGWANFIFDPTSAFFGKSAGEVWRLVTSGERLDKSRSNLSLAWNDFLYNPSWQHYDVWSKLLQTLVMAFVGTVLATVIAFPLSFLAARNITPSRGMNQITKRFFDFLRSVDMLIWALFFTRAFGPGPLAGISAIFFTDTGTLGKLYSEALENIDDKQREGMKSVGASPLAVQRFGVMPQVLPVFASQALYFWESNTRSATIIGAVGAGGIGLKLWEAMRTNSNWQNVCYMVLLILLVVFLFDGISNSLRSRLIGKNSQ
ncbi:phosphonate ABC transporter, permease protein PhnE [Rhizobium paknamense]|uniref:Phosphonate transport system permease protein n=1 Tax=Rhizobium paknamense TaxID=1206817 RepID=A0ABU0IC93_9HYPH|nr:phosphonate ABC transporter, permease protein PhnE [Rhizobium paknamense]MDQ0455863.1 phosphonate transport system permease protein [Rhizobium paknamense]